jgi:RNA polymerase sigma-54 factor
LDGFGFLKGTMNSKLSFQMQTKMGLGMVLTSKLLRVPGIELEQLIWRELSDNPALEAVSREEIHTQKSLASLVGFGLPAQREASCWVSPNKVSPESGQEHDSVIERLVAIPSTIDQLIAQMALMVDENESEIAIYLLHSLDGHGYLRSATEDLAVELSISSTSIEKVIQVLHQLDPPGIGARSFQECLLIQCSHLEEKGEDCQVVRRILMEGWDDFSNQRWRRVAQKLCLPYRIVEEARCFIARNFYPYPLQLVEGSSTSQERAAYPDMIIHREPGYDRSKYTIEIPRVEALELRVSTCFERIMRAGIIEQRELLAAEKKWVRTQVDRARLFITALEQRWSTLRRIGEFLIDYQVEFLNSGPCHLKPLTQAAVAKALDLHESTISRTISEKIVQLPDGRLTPLSDFFDHSLVSKEAICQLVACTNRPLSDREIAKHLKIDGIDLSRRTVAKYRQQLNIPPSYHR